MTAEGMTIGLYVASIEMHAPRRSRSFPNLPFTSSLRKPLEGKRLIFTSFLPANLT